VALCVANAGAQAALLGRAPATPGGTDFRAYYDSDFDLTWMADANYPTTTDFGVPGILLWLPGIPGQGSMPWDTAYQWIAALNASNYLGANNWRLPTTVQPDPTCGQPPNQEFFCQNGELGHLYYSELGGVAAKLLSQNHNSNYEFFRNIGVSAGSYWTATELQGNTSEAWIFGMNAGFQHTWPKQYSAFVWPVVSGDPLNSVPLPAAFFFMASALGALGFCKSYIARVR
jgi:hypothetical protein